MSKSQNIFDNQEFFDGYKKIRNNRYSANNLEEKPALFDEMNALATPEAKLFKSLDNLEAVVSHNEADISTWIPLEYEENLVYDQKN